MTQFCEVDEPVTSFSYNYISAFHESGARELAAQLNL
jgi:hypothetical protein